MSGFAATRALVEATFAAAWATAQPTVALEFENVEGELHAGAVPRARLVILDGVASEIGIGAPNVRHDGLVQVEVVDAPGVGTARARGIADSAAAILGGQVLESVGAGRVIFRAAYATSRGVVDGWYRIAVTVPFVRDE